MRYVITGSDGALGGVLSELLRHPSGNHAVKHFNRADLDITNQNALDQIIDYKPDAVFNCAAYNNVDGAETEPGRANEINGYAVGKLASVCRLLGATLLHFSTDYIFDGTNKSGNTESADPNPVNAYGRSKLLGETELQRIGGNYYIIRTAWLYGGKASGRSAKKSFVDLLAEQTRAGTEIKVVSDQYGTPTYIPDLAQAAYELVQDQAPFGIYHFINDGRTNRYEWAEEIFKILGLSPRLKAISYKDLPSKALRPQYSFLVNTKRPALRRWQSALKDYLKKL